MQWWEHRWPVFATGQFASPEPERARTAAYHPFRPFSKVARQIRIKDEDGRHSVGPSRVFQNLPDKKNSGTRTDEIVLSPLSPLSPAVPHRLPLFSIVFRFFQPSPAVPRCPPPSSTTPYRPLSPPTRICLRSWGLSSFLMMAVLEIQGRGRTAFCPPVQSFSQVARQVGMKDEDGLRFAVPPRPGLLAVPRRALRGPRTTANTG